MRSKHTVFGFLAILGMNACASEEPAPPFTEIYTEVLSPSCGFSSCHAGSAGAPFLETEDSAYASLVNAESNSVDGAILVIPGDPDNSYLVQKLESGPSITGNPMPPSSALPDEKIEAVRAWIEAGASRD